MKVAGMASSRLGAVARRIAEVVKGLLVRCDSRDALLVTGLGFMSIGLGEAWPPLAWIVPGAVLTLLGVLGKNSTS